MLERVQPPRERPDRDLRIVEDTDVLPAGLDQDPGAEVQEREQRVGGGRDQAGVARLGEAARFDTSGGRRRDRGHARTLLSTLAERSRRGGPERRETAHTQRMGVGVGVAPRLSRGWFALLVIGLLLLAAAFVAYRLFDFGVFDGASSRLQSGGHLYATQAQVDARTSDYYVYPPLLAFLLAPLSHLPFALAGAVYAAGMIAALAASLRLCGVTDPRCYIALLLSLPVLQTIGLGTIEPLLVLALALAWRYRDRPWLGSGALGFAIAAKLFLWPMLLWLLLTGRIRRSAETAAAAAALTLVPWGAMGFRGLTWYPEMLRLIVRTEHASGWGLPLVAADLAFVALLVAVSGPGGDDRRVFGACVIACLLLTPLVWLHYYVVLIVPIALASRRFGWVWVVPIAAAWPFTDTHGSTVVKLWGWLVLAALAFAVARPARGARVESARSGLDLAQRAGVDLVDEAAHPVAVLQEGRVAHARDRLPDVGVDVLERLDRKGRSHPGRRLQLGAEAVVGDQLQAAVGVVDEHDLLGPEAALRDRERADHVVGDHAARVPEHVRLAVVEPQRREDVEPAVHARDDREAERRRDPEPAVRVARRELAVVPEQLVDHVHRYDARPRMLWSSNSTGCGASGGGGGQPSRPIAGISCSCSNCR